MRGRLVEQEADKDIKEGGMEQTGRPKKPAQLPPAFPHHNSHIRATTGTLPHCSLGG